MPKKKSQGRQLLLSEVNPKNIGVTMEESKKRLKEKLKRRKAINPVSGGSENLCQDQYQSSSTDQEYQLAIEELTKKVVHHFESDIQARQWLTNQPLASYGCLTPLEVAKWFGSGELLIYLQSKELGAFE
ncbi:hypothetical protein IC617_05370 [Neiella sp. HB171785]|uniref:Uncharacterized protein n=1 Tax=Neiella litorisoli TaxID=2771431 RepID=A0A8J6QPS4_9GAMM|nr:hypothetical protein [Neiella litorisoli]MBD1388851.1 hypothetical protein [Neiella litorisoli]